MNSKKGEHSNLREYFDILRNRTTKGSTTAIYTNRKWEEVPGLSIEMTLVVTDVMDAKYVYNEVCRHYQHFAIYYYTSLTCIFIFIFILIFIFIYIYIFIFIPLLLSLILFLILPLLLMVPY
jgi:hypothetical protein